MYPNRNRRVATPEMKLRKSFSRVAVHVAQSFDSIAKMMASCLTSLWDVTSCLVFYKAEAPTGLRHVYDDVTFSCAKNFLFALHPSPVGEISFVDHVSQQKSWRSDARY